MLTPREAFKVGFLARCASAGMTTDEIGLAVKSASEKCALLGEAINAATTAGKTILGYGLPALLAAPPIIGGLTGYGLAKATDISDTDVGDIKDREVLDSYRRHTDQLKRQRAIKDYQKARQQTGRIL